jgi:hypothetical protein
MSANPTHRTRLARSLANAAGISYQKALAQVRDAAAAGILPARLDPDGMRDALELLVQQHAASRHANSEAQPLDSG